MIKIKLIVPKLLSNNQSIKGNTHVFDLEYEQPVTVGQVIKDNKINMLFLGFILLDGKKNVNKIYLIEQSCELKLFIVMCGG